MTSDDVPIALVKIGQTVDGSEYFWIVHVTGDRRVIQRGDAPLDAQAARHALSQRGFNQDAIAWFFREAREYYHEESRRAPEAREGSA